MASQDIYACNIRSIIIFHTFVSFFGIQGLSISNYTKLPFINATSTYSIHGYTTQEHTVSTEDGYILTTFRIFKDKCELRRPPVLLMHGLLLSSDGFLDPGPTMGLPYLLADKCFEVWLGNQRGNYFARRHKKMNADKDVEFWNFSIDEIGLYDAPATVDYILKYSNVPKLNYIGFSQGSCAFFIMCSERPEYSNKVNLHIGLAPVSRLIHTRSVLFRSFLILMQRMQTTLSSAGFNEVLARGAIGQEFLAFTCQLTWRTEKLCESLMSLLDTRHPGSISNDTLNNLFNHFPAGTSLKTLVKFAQSLETPRFAKFDYGELKNIEIYGNKQPPSFNLSAVVVPSVLMYGRNDLFLDKEDVFWLVEQLPNVLESVEVRDPLWNHLDFVVSKHIPDKIFPTLHRYLQDYSEL